MKANIPRAWRRLSPAEQKRIEEMKQKEINHNVMIVLDIFLKMSCQVMHDTFGFGEKRLNIYLGSYRRLFKRNIKNVRAGTQIKELDRTMQRVFRRDGYPDEFFRLMFEDWSIDTKESSEFAEQIDGAAIEETPVTREQRVHSTKKERESE